MSRTRYIYVVVVSCSARLLGSLQIERRATLGTEILHRSCGDRVSEQKKKSAPRPCFLPRSGTRDRRRSGALTLNLAIYLLPLPYFFSPSLVPRWCQSRLLSALYPELILFSFITSFCHGSPVFPCSVPFKVHLSSYFTTAHGISLREMALSIIPRSGDCETYLVR